MNARAGTCFLRAKPWGCGRVRIQALPVQLPEQQRVADVLHGDRIGASEVGDGARDAQNPAANRGQEMQPEAIPPLEVFPAFEWPGPRTVKWVTSTAVAACAPPPYDYTDHYVYMDAALKASSIFVAALRCGCSLISGLRLQRFNTAWPR